MSCDAAGRGAGTAMLASSKYTLLRSARSTETVSQLPGCTRAIHCRAMSRVSDASAPSDHPRACTELRGQRAQKRARAPMNNPTSSKTRPPSTRTPLDAGASPSSSDSCVLCVCGRRAVARASSGGVRRDSPQGEGCRSCAVRSSSNMVVMRSASWSASSSESSMGPAVPIAESRRTKRRFSELLSKSSLNEPSIGKATSHRGRWEVGRVIVHWGDAYPAIRAERPVRCSNSSPTGHSKTRAMRSRSLASGTDSPRSQRETVCGSLLMRRASVSAVMPRARLIAAMR